MRFPYFDLSVKTALTMNVHLVALELKRVAIELTVFTCASIWMQFTEMVMP